MQHRIAQFSLMEEAGNGKFRRKQNALWGTHGTQKYNGEDFEVEIRILAQKAKTLARKILRSFR